MLACCGRLQSVVRRLSQSPHGGRCVWNSTQSIVQSLQQHGNVLGGVTPASSSYKRRSIFCIISRVTNNSKRGCAVMERSFHQYYVVGDNASDGFLTRAFSTSLETDFVAHDEESLEGMKVQESTNKTNYFKPWSDPARTLDSRVESFVEAERIHPAEFVAGGALINDCCRIGGFEGMKMAQDVMDRLLLEKYRLVKEHDNLRHINERFWQYLLFGWAKMANKATVAQDRMGEILNQAIQEAKADAALEEKYAMQDPDYFKSERPSLSEPKVGLFNAYLYGLQNAAIKSPGAALKAEQTLFDMMDLNTTRGWYVKPNRRSYTLVMQAFESTRNQGSVRNVLGIMEHVRNTNKMERLQYEENFGVPYNSIDEGANKDVIVSPDAAMYAVVLKAVRNSRDPARSAMVVFNRMLKEEKEGILATKVDALHFCQVIQAFGEQIEIPAPREARLHLAREAEAVLQGLFDRMESLNEEQLLSKDGDYNAARIIGAFNSCLDAWKRTNTPEGAQRCEELLTSMLKSENSAVRPDAVSFNICVQAWSRCARHYPNSADRAEEVLRLHQNMFSSGEIKQGPDFQSWNIAISARKNSLMSRIEDDNTTRDDAEVVRYARAMLEEMIAGVKRGDVVALRNAASPFCAVILAAAEARSLDVPGKTDSNAWDDNVFENREDPYSIACRTYDEVVDDVYQLGAKPDHHIYGAMLKCIAKHCAPESTERQTRADAIFAEACRTGNVSRIVWEEAVALLPDISEKVISINNRNPHELPRIWSVNVDHKMRMRFPRK